MIKIKNIIIIISIILISSILIYGCNKNNNYKIKIDNELYNNYDYESLSNDKLETLISDKHSFILYTYNPYCPFKIPCETIFKSVLKDLNIKLYNIAFEDLKKTSLNDKISYAPSVIIFDKGKIKSYLDAESDKDYNKYQDYETFKKWIEANIVL